MEMQEPLRNEQNGGNLSIIIRNMVCDRCRTAVRHLLEGSGVRYVNVQLGEVELEEALTPSLREAIAAGLAHLGFELVDDRNARTIEHIKASIIALLRSNALSVARKEKLSVHLAREIGMEYSGLSNLFSSATGMTIERYHILQRLERAKELLVYDELSLTQIADQLGYSSVQHLSNQFTQYAGHTPSHFKRLGTERRKALDKVH